MFISFSKQRLLENRGFRCLQEMWSGLGDNRDEHLAIASSMYARPMWEMMALTHSSTFSHILSFHSNSLKFTQKPLQNSNKLG